MHFFGLNIYYNGPAAASQRQSGDSAMALIVAQLDNPAADARDVSALLLSGAGKSKGFRFYCIERPSAAQGWLGTPWKPLLATPPRVGGGARVYMTSTGKLTLYARGLWSIPQLGSASASSFRCPQEVPVGSATRSLRGCEVVPRRVLKGADVHSWPCMGRDAGVGEVKPFVAVAFDGSAQSAPMPASIDWQGRHHPSGDAERGARLTLRARALVFFTQRSSPHPSF